MAVHILILVTDNIGGGGGEGESGYLSDIPTGYFVNL